MTHMLAGTFVRASLAIAIITVAAVGAANAQGSVYTATLGEMNAKTGEVSTAQVHQILADGSAIVLDSRKRSEYVAGHIAGAQNVAPPEGAPPAAYIAAIEKLEIGRAHV